MDAILTRTADLPATPLPQARAPGIGRRLGKVLSTLAYAALERITSPQRDMPPEFYRFPLF